MMGIVAALAVAGLWMTCLANPGVIPAAHEPGGALWVGVPAQPNPSLAACPVQCQSCGPKVFLPEGGAVLLYLQTVWCSSWTQGRRCLTATCTARTAEESGCTGSDKAGQQLTTANTALHVTYGEWHMWAPAGWAPASKASPPAQRPQHSAAPGTAILHAEPQWVPEGQLLL